MLYLRAERSDTIAQLKAKISGYASTDQLTIHDVVLRTEWNYPVEQYTGTASARLDVPKHTKPEGIRLYIRVGLYMIKNNKKYRKGLWKFHRFITSNHHKTGVNGV